MTYVVITRKICHYNEKICRFNEKRSRYYEKRCRFNEKRSRYNDIIEWKKIMSVAAMRHRINLAKKLLSGLCLKQQAIEDLICEDQVHLRFFFLISFFIRLL